MLTPIGREPQPRAPRDARAGESSVPLAGRQAARIAGTPRRSARPHTSVTMRSASMSRSETTNATHDPSGLIATDDGVRIARTSSTVMGRGDCCAAIPAAWAGHGCSGDKGEGSAAVHDPLQCLGVLTTWRVTLRLADPDAPAPAWRRPPSGPSLSRSVHARTQPYIPSDGERLADVKNPPNPRRGPDRRA